MILTYFTARSTKVANAFEWGKFVKCNGRKLALSMQMDKRFMFIKKHKFYKKKCPKGAVALFRGYIHVYDPDSLTYFLKPLGQSKPKKYK